jgi:hypothetical protein
VSAGDVDEHDAALLAAVDRAVPGWVVRSVQQVAGAAGIAIDGSARARLDAAAAAAQGEVRDRLERLLALDVDEQRTNPLSILRDAVRHPTAVLRSLKVPPVPRDDFARSAFPDDDYGLTPATWRDVDESLHEPGIVWGAAKAHRVLARRRAEGRLPARTDEG